MNRSDTKAKRIYGTRQDRKDWSRAARRTQDKQVVRAQMQEQDPPRKRGR